MKKDYIYITIIGVLLIGLGILAINNNNKNSDNNNDSKPTNSSSNNQTINDNDDDSNSNNYVRYTESTIYFVADAKIQNGVLKISYKNNDIKISNLPNNAKYFTYITACDGALYLLVLTTDGTVYHATNDDVYGVIQELEADPTSSRNFNDVNIDFKKLDVQNVKDITTGNFVGAGESECLNERLHIITRDNQEKIVDYDDDMNVVIK